MGIFSNRIGKDELKPGDHIYSWRTGYVYSHHGIYVDDNKVIHFTSSDINLTCSVPQQPKVPCLNCTENEAADGVVSSCLDCFLGGCDLYRFEYSVSLAVFLAQVRSGTCTRAHSDPNETAIHRAKCLFDNGFGCYNVFKNNCEDFAIYCKTGLLVVDQGVLGLSDQATSIIGGSLAAVLSMSLRLVTKNVFGMAAVATVSYCANRCATDIARQRNVRKVEVEDLIEGLKGGIMADTNLAPPLFRVENEEIEGLGLEEDTNYFEAESASREEEEEEKESALKEEKDFDLKEEEKDGWFHYPVRSQEPRSDCLFYLRTGTCQFGLNCKFNHPPREKGKVGGEEKKNEHENEKEKGKEKKKDEENEEEKCEEKEHKNEEFPEREGQPTCKYFLKPGGCKFGKACRYNHPRAKARARELVDLNFCGLPIRPGKKECAYYMRTGSCKFETNCRFHHPDPTVVGGCEPLPVYRNDSSRTLHGSRSSPPLPTALSRTSNEGVPDIEASPPPYVPVILPPPHSVHPCAEWNGFLGSGSSSAIIDLTKKADSSTSQNHTIVEEFPERPGQQECQFYMKTGNCKFKSACIYHHPKTQVSISPARCVLSSMGLPLRPDQNICKRYSRFGICNFGPACMYDHPIN